MMAKKDFKNVGFRLSPDEAEHVALVLRQRRGQSAKLQPLLEELVRGWISTGQEGAEVKRAPMDYASGNAEWHARLEDILNSEHPNAVTAVQENLIAFHRLIKVDSPKTQPRRKTGSR